MEILSREQYHQRRIARALAEVAQHYYDFYGSYIDWPTWVFEEEAQAKKCVCDRICREDGFTA